MLPTNDNELSESALEAVSGGGIVSIIRRIVSLYRASNYRSNGSGGGGGFSCGGGGGGGAGGGGFR